MFDAQFIVADANSYRYRVNDYDADGDLDVLAKDSFGEFRLYEQTAGLTDFELVPGLGQQLLDGVFADIDGVGSLDLVTAIDASSDPNDIRRNLDLDQRFQYQVTVVDR